MKKRSEKRQRTIPLAGRFTPAEAEAVRAKADACGGVSAFIRHATLGAKLPRHVADREAINKLEVELAKIRAELSKSGSNLNQLTKYANMDRLLANSIAAAIEEHNETRRELLEWRTLLMQAVGEERKRKPRS